VEEHVDTLKTLQFEFELETALTAMQHDGFILFRNCGAAGQVALLRERYAMLLFGDLNKILACLCSHGTVHVDSVVAFRSAALLLLADLLEMHAQVSHW